MAITRRSRKNGVRLSTVAHNGRTGWDDIYFGREGSPGASSRLFGLVYVVVDQGRASLCRRSLLYRGLELTLPLIENENDTCGSDAR